MSQLPAEFADLEPHLDWAIPTMTGRVQKRVSSTIDEVQAFYDAMLPRVEAVVTYLDRHHSLDDMPEDAQRLLDMALSLAEVATSVEYYSATRVPRGVEHERFPIVAPSHVW